TARASTGAPTGTHTIRVQQLAEGVRFHSGSDITKDGGKVGGTLAEQFDLQNVDPDGKIRFTITNGGVNGGQAVVTAEFELDVNVHTIRDVVAAINASGLELHASYEADLDRFFLASKNTGEAVAISFEDDNGFLADVLDLRTRVGDDPDAHIDPNEVYKG